MFQFNISQASLEHNFQSFGYLHSELTLVVVLLLIVFVDLLFKDAKKSFFVNGLIFTFAMLLCMYFSISEYINPYYGPIGLFFTKIGLYYNGEIESLSEAMMYLTKQGSFFKFLMALSALFLMIFNQLDYKKNTDSETKVEYLVAIIAILLGSFILVSASHFLTVLLALEISSFGAYALIYFQSDKSAKEASLKYILYGLTATGLMLFGMSILYAELGSLSYNALISSCMVELHLSSFLVLGIGLLSIGLFFKLAVVPMYFWVPDAFEGGPISGIAFLSLVPKFGVLGNLIVLFSYIFHAHLGILSIQNILLIIGAITLTMANFFALGQTNIKRLLGYSSVAHSGFLLIALAIFGATGLNSLLYYALVYVFMNFLVFMGAAYFANKTQSYNILDWKGLGTHSVLMGVLLTIGLAALIGLPPTAGFSAKLFVFAALIELYGNTGDTFILTILIIGIFNIILSLFYYLKIPFYLFFQKSEQVNDNKTSVLSNLQVCLVALPLIALFLFSEQVLVLIKQVNDIVKYFVQ